MRRSDELPVRREREWGLSPWEASAWPLGGSSFFSGSPWRMMRRMEEEMDRLLAQLLSGGEQEGQAAGMEFWTPRIDFSQTEREWRIEAELPGVNRDDIQVEMRDNNLILRAEVRREEREGEPEQEYFRRERRYGMFRRVFPLPEGVNADQIRCEYRDGVLTVHVPRPAESRQQRRIPIEWSEERRRPVEARTETARGEEVEEEEEAPARAA